jgi:outer membrane protein TolC
MNWTFPVKHIPTALITLGISLNSFNAAGSTTNVKPTDLRLAADDNIASSLNNRSTTVTATDSSARLNAENNIELSNVSAAKVSVIADTDSVIAGDEPFLVFNEEIIVLTVNNFVNQVIKSNAKISYADIQRNIAKERIAFEEGVYETELFSNLSYDDSQLQRSAGDKFASSLGSQNKQELLESNANLTFGLRRLIGTGGEVTLTHSTSKKNNNIIPASIDPSDRDSEYTTAVNLEFTQPLLKGFGGIATGTRIKRAKIEDEIEDAQYRQEMLKVVFEATSYYWQLYKISGFISVREAALINAKKSLKDMERKVSLGKGTKNLVLDAKSQVLKRKIAFDSARQARNEITNKISTLINVNPNNLNELVFDLHSKPDTRKFELTVPFEEYFNQILVDWPNYQIVDFNISIQDQEIKLADNELKPNLDLKVGYKFNDLDDEYNGFDSYDNEHPSWYIGLNFSMPIGGNDRNNAKKVIAKLKRDQHREDLNAVKIGLQNDLKAKLFQVQTTYQEMMSLTENVVLLEELSTEENKKFGLGYGELIDVYDREDDLNLEKQRLIDGQVKYEIAKASLALADGTLLKQYNVAN